LRLGRRPDRGRGKGGGGSERRFIEASQGLALWRMKKWSADKLFRKARAIWRAVVAAA
jgi:hypothetical protein